MGLTFKENCPDHRNTRVVDLVKEFKSFSCNVDVYDPRVNKKQVAEEYKIEPIDKPIKDKYDAIASIEMIEAVGHDNIPKYMNRVSDMLVDKGIFALQGITYNDQNFNNYKNSVDFINKYIFPGACLISISQIMESLKSDTDLILQDLDDITNHYGRTLNIWRKNFLDKKNDVKKLGFSSNFIRLWEFYLVYCEAGFLEKNIGDYQFIFTK